MKRIIALIFAAVLCISFSMPSIASSEGLIDLESSKYSVEINKLVDDGIISGYTDGTFRPKNNITRGELATVLVKALGLEENKAAAEHFTDVNGKWHQGYIGALFEKGIFVGKSETNFGAEDNVTRQELAALVIRIFGFQDIADKMTVELNFADASDIGIWAQSAVSFATKIGLMDGIENEDGTVSFLPLQAGERELIAKLVYELKYNRDTYTEKINSLLEVVGILDESASTESEQKPADESNEEKPSYDSIVSKYLDKLSSLENKISGQLSSLMDKAMKEYNSGVPVSELIDKYLSQALSLESSADSQVSSLLSGLSGELSAHGYDTSVVGELQAQYEAIKQSLRDSIPF